MAPSSRSVLSVALGTVLVLSAFLACGPQDASRFSADWPYPEGGEPVVTEMERGDRIRTTDRRKPAHG
ncbi:MAG: hypothetical protein U5R14_11230 [Gemmatimonadota bacterium]|nr:hypothetical protein [Gemmatimonadota bacterium]